MRFRTIRTMAALFCGLGIVFAAGAAGAQSADDLIPAKVRQAGKVVIGSAIAQVPWEFYDENQKPVGVDVDICSGAAKSLGLEAEWVHVDFKNLIPALQAGRFDMVCAGLFITQARAEVVNLLPYIQTGQTILARSDFTAEVKDFADLCGFSVGLQQGSPRQALLEELSRQCVAAGKGAIDVRAFETQPIAILALKNGQVDTFTSSDQLTAYYQQRDASLKRVVTGLSPVQIGMAFRKDQTGLTAMFAKALYDMRETGEYKKILEKWNIVGAGTLWLE